MFHRERTLLQQLRDRPNPHIVTHFASIVYQSIFYICFPLARCNLRSFLNRVTAPPLHQNVVLWFFSQTKGLTDAVSHLHALGDAQLERQWSADHPFVPTRPVFHGDIKPENILIFPSIAEAPLGILKLSDFGSAQTSEDFRRTSFCGDICLGGTKAYQSPDLLKSSELSCATDIWSLGCVFLELLVWLFYPPGSEETGFMTQRAMDSLPHNSSFWTLTAAGKVDMKPSVARRLLDLEHDPCSKKLSLELFLQLIWYLIHPAPHSEEFSALRISHDISACMRQAERDLARDPNYFLDPTASSKDYATPAPSWASWDPELSNQRIASYQSDLHSPITTKRKSRDRWAFYRKYPRTFKGIENVPPQTLQEAVEKQRLRETVPASVVSEPQNRSVV